MLLWFGVIIALILFIYLKVYRPVQKWKELGVPYIEPVPFLGNIASFMFRIKSMPDWVKDMYNYHPSSRYIGLYQFNQSILMLKDLELIKQIGIKDFDTFVDHPPFVTEDIDPLFGKNLFALTGQKWRNMRATLSPAFTGSKMRAMFVLISDCAEQLANYFKEETKSGKPIIIEMKDIFTRFANDVIASTAFGITCDSLKEKDNEFYLMGKDATNFGGTRAIKIFGYSISKRLMRMCNIKLFSDDVSNFFRNIITNNINSREKQGIIRPDMIHLLMEARKGKLMHEDHKVKDEDAGFATVEESQVGKEIQQAKFELSDEDITAQALLFFIAGFDTISTAICHMAYELALNEDIQERLQEEIDEIIKEHKGNISYEAILKMKYLDMVLSETLRKWPAVPAMDRACNDDYIIPAKYPNERPIHLKKNDMVWFPCYGLHRDPQYFPNPEKFDPERFNDENKVNIKPLSYIPFGVGPRNCIGSRFALLEAKIVFCHMLTKFSFEICEKSQVPLKLSKSQFNMNAEKGFWLALKPRNI